jgi:hypothetical protein
VEASVTCANGHPNPADAEFCSECGQPLTWGSTSVWVVSERSKEFDESEAAPDDAAKESESEDAS